MLRDTPIFPNILQSTLLVFSLILINYFVKHLFAFVGNETLISLLSEILKLILLSFFITIMIKRNRIQKITFDLGDVALVVLSFGILASLANQLLPYPNLSYFEDDKMKEILTETIYKQSDVFYMILMVFIGPLFEELLFRGIILKGLLSNYRPSVAIIVSALMFGILHLDMLNAFSFAVILGWLYYRTKNLSYCILIHMICNAIGFLLRFMASNGYLNIEQVNSYFKDNVFIVSASVIAFCVSIFMIARFTKVNEIIDKEALQALESLKEK